MTEPVIDLRSVNWVQGMFLTPEHFLRQERYFDSLALWLTRYGFPATGLVGGGPRVALSERGAPRFDPIWDLLETDDALTLSVSQCRGITPGGAIVEIESAQPIRRSFPKGSLQQASELSVYVVALPHEKMPEASAAATSVVAESRRVLYDVAIDLSPEKAQWSLVVGRIRRSATSARFEAMGGFIPPCALMSAHSDLMHGFRVLNERVASLADRYGAIHRDIVDFIGLAKPRGLDVEADAETLAFVGRMVVALEACAYEILDPLQTPRRFFLHLNRLVRSAALFLSLSPPTTEYFRLLADLGDTEFLSFLDEDRAALSALRASAPDENLATDTRRAAQSLERLERLERALEGKYIDFRRSRSLESVGFLFDRTRGEAVLYRAQAKPARPQAEGQDVTFVFAPLQLDTREAFRVVLIGEPDAVFHRGDRVTVELRINRGEGYQREKEHLTAETELEDQRNFAFDFKVPGDVVRLTDLRVTLQSRYPIRSAMLYARERLTGRAATVFSSRPEPTPPPVPRPPSPEPSPGPRPEDDKRRRRILS